MGKIDYKDIVEKAYLIRKGVEKQHKLVDSKKWSYYFAKSILKPGTDIKKISFLKEKEYIGDNFNQEIPKKDYLNMAERFVKYVEENGRLPNYITVNGKKMKVRDYEYMFSWVLVFYEKKKRLPGIVPVNSQLFKSVVNTIKKFGRSTKSGCDNRGQNTDYWCGPHMAQEIIRNLTGVVIPQSKIASIMGTTTSGTGHSGIETFFLWFNKNYDYTLKWTWKNFSDLGWSGLKKIHESNDQDAGEHECYKLNWGHYTNYDKIYDNTVDVHNSLGDYCDSGCHCGYTENRSKSTAKSYLDGISQKSIFVVTRVK